jgi:hypothetical protein
MVTAGQAAWYLARQRRRRENPAAIPDAVTDLVVTAQGPNEVEIVFTPSAGADFHQVRYRALPDGTWSDNAGVEPEDVLSGLLPATAYQVQVSAYSERWGRSEWASATVETDAEE